MGSIEFLADVLASGLDFEQVTPDDVFKHVPIESLAATLPTDLKAALVAASLKAEKMDHRFVLEVLGVDAVCRAAVSAQVWACIAACAVRALESGGGHLGGGKGGGSSKDASGAGPVAAVAPSTKGAAAGSGEPSPTAISAASPSVEPSTRRPQAAATASSPAKSRAATASSRRGGTDFDLDLDTDVGAEWPTERSATVRPEDLGADDSLDENFGEWGKGDETPARDGVKRK